MQLISTKKATYFLVAFALFLLLKLGYTFSTTEQLKFLLEPTNKMVSLLTGSTAVYSNPNGYYHKALHIIINKSCSGFNYWLICFLMLTFLLLKYVQKKTHLFMVIPIALISAYLITIFTNSSRILASLLIEGQNNATIESYRHLVHEAIGVTTNISFLILFYYLSEKLINTYYYEKFIKP